ncbi:class I SAM-dependent methyltransferase [Lentibacillus cibarius]|uniref:Class I SAM-dependent methyltransferase n=1 Tax=Lentibacillus cibarius TaxID=2583219 RepID=A0A5S3QJV2_9BACI|nr:class I SAM-dependent methyltransferase [Lentibacillus cibarius]TMN22204.1 class I SAM-dependent methyltransferase [Lentibacillus cibarius]
MIEDTGERIIPENMKITNEMLMEHVARYHFASDYVYGRVLDFASGAGYGTHILAKRSKAEVHEVIGVDLDPDAIHYARGTYHHPSSAFMEGDVTNVGLPEKLGTFDCVVSFETIEHIEAEEQFLANVYALLKPGGTLILSTPFGQGRGKPCKSPFHVHQLTVDEFKQLFTGYTIADFYYQRGPLIISAEDYYSGRYPIGIAVCQK